MRTFGLALRAVSLAPEVTVQEVFEQSVEDWRVRKVNDKRAMSKSFSLTRQRDIDMPEGRLVEFLADQRADHEGRWRTLIRMFQQPNEPAWITFEMSLEDMAQRFAPAVYEVQPPRLLRELGKRLSMKTADGWDVPRTALDVSDTLSVGHLADEILDSKRLVPLVVVTEPVYAQAPVKNLAGVLGEHLFGLARVVHVGPKLTHTLTSRLGKELSVFDGGVRIYWPGVEIAAPPQRHPLILRRAIENAGANAKRWILDALARKLIPVTTARFREPEPLRALVRRIDSDKLQEAQLSQLELTEKLEATAKELHEAREYEQAAYAEIRKLELEKADLEADLAEVRREAAKWQAHFDNLRRKSEARGEPVAVAPQDATEALEQARKKFADTLILPEDITLETDLGPDVYDVLHAMHDAVLRERSRKMGDRQKAFAELFGQHLNHPARYEPGPTGLRYANEECRHRVHLKSGKPDETESVYWLERAEVSERKYLIFRVGRHA